MLASALGLGNARVVSKLNQPLNIELELLATNPKELLNMAPALASPDDFERAGIDRPNYLNAVQFKVETQGGKSFVRLTTKEAIKEPMVNLLVELTWSQGRILKDYTVLLDPPEFAKKEVPQTQIQTQAKPAENTHNSSALFDAFEEKMPTISANKQVRQAEAQQKELNQALQARLGKIEQQLTMIAEQKQQVEQAKTALKEENNNLHDLVQLKQKEIEALKEARVEPVAAATPAPTPNKPLQQRSELSNFAKAQILEPVEDPSHTAPSPSAPWLLLGLILTILMSGVIGLRELFKRKELAFPFDVNLPTFSLGKNTDKSPLKAGGQAFSPLTNYQPNQQAFQGAVSEIKAAEEKQEGQLKGTTSDAPKQPVSDVVLPTLDDAEIYITFSKFKMAEEIISKILNHDPNHIKARFKLIDILFAQERLSEIDEQFTLLPPNASKEYPDEFRVYHERIKNLQWAKVPQDAPGSPEEQTKPDNNLLEPSVEFIENFAPPTADLVGEPPAVDLDPALFQTKLDFAKVYIDMNDMESARDLLNEVIQSGPEALKAEAEALLAKT